MVSKDNERRRAKRVSYICEIQCEGKGIGRLNTRINDISITGLFIDSLAHLAIGSILKMRFVVLGLPMEIEGEVRYCMPQVGMGIQFLKLKPEQEYAIRCLVEKEPFDKNIYLSLTKSTVPLNSGGLTLPQNSPPTGNLSTGKSPQPANEANPPTAPLNKPAPPPAGTRVPTQNLNPPQAVRQMNSGYLAQSMPDEQTILTGNFAIINLFDVIQMIENSKVSGELVIPLNDEQGIIYFNEGRLVNAKFGLLTGSQALSIFLDLHEGSFAFRKTDKAYTQIFHTGNNTGLLLDILASKDEENAHIN
ncbi:MAG: DUF4388 domain-containing protein [Acidobacteriota bacterium]